ncbi:MAG TPA: FtsX-like permease family protein [Thermoanaerobaculia bacterium]|jgi:ABC-type antimicrobial peptide transport system permease subunit|nr:FtsX-like permease family protein [Thermoanaerobaculia bacterium]
MTCRGEQRRGEFALRAALGAGSGRLIRQLLTESLFLAAVGGAVGMAVALLGVRALVALSPPGLPRAGAITVDGSVFVFGLIVTSLIGLAVGLIPALQAARKDPNRDLQKGSRRTAGGRTRSALVIAEVALALLLLVSSGLLLRSVERLFAVAPGFDPSHLLTMQIQTSGHRFDADGATQDQPIVRVATMDTLLATTAAERRFALVLFETFALAALLLAAAGIYGVLSGSITERTREIGVRAVLGATRRDILALIIRQGMTLTGLGVALGVLGSLAATQALVALLFGVSRLDPVTYLAVIALLAAVALLACGMPAWRAARVDPAITLRAE